MFVPPFEALRAVMLPNMPSLRFLGTAVLGSAVAALLLSYVAWGHMAEAPFVRVTPASPEMMQMLRDEHGLVADMLKLQMTKEY
jgi:hypothetical protein